MVVLDTEVTQELEAEGMARDVVRQIQEARKAEGLVVTDRIELWLELEASARAAVVAHEQYVADQVLAVALTYGAGPSDATAHNGVVEATATSIWLKTSDVDLA